jgi:hypothetical protein
LAKLDGHRLLLALLADAGTQPGLRTGAARVLTAACRDRRSVAILHACDTEALVAQRLATLVKKPPPPMERRGGASVVGSAPADPEAITETEALLLLAAAMVTTSTRCELRLVEVAVASGGIGPMIADALSLQASSDQTAAVTCAAALLLTLVSTVRRSAATAAAIVPPRRFGLAPASAVAHALRRYREGTIHRER